MEIACPDRLHGHPKSMDVLRKLTDLSSIGYYRFVETQVAGVDCLVARMGYTGEFGYEIHFDPQYGREMWSAIMGAGADLGISPYGQAALESLRQEAGYLLVGNVHDKATNPLEAGIGFTVKFSKVEFNGKQALEKIAQRGVGRHLVWLDVPSGHVTISGDAITLGEMKIGQVTSGSYSPTRKRGTAMGYVRPEHAIPGLTVRIESEGGFCDATLSVMPLYEPGNLRTRSGRSA